MVCNLGTRQCLCLKYWEQNTKNNGDGKVVLVDSIAKQEALLSGLPEPRPTVDLDLKKVLRDMPRKKCHFTRRASQVEALDIAPGSTISDALYRVLHLPSVCSKRFLTTKVDRCVTGLVAQQQTVGPLQLPLADVAVYSKVEQAKRTSSSVSFVLMEQSYSRIEYVAGSSHAVLLLHFSSYRNCCISPRTEVACTLIVARLALGEALTDLVWAKVTALKDVKASGNWMYAAKLDGEGADMFDAAESLHGIALEVAIDCREDSLSMAAQAGGETVKAPGNLGISACVSCPDITKTVTPDLKLGDEIVLLHIDLGDGKRRLGGSALAQVYDQIGYSCPDVEDIQYFKAIFEAVQGLLDKRLVASGHDISDGGIVIALQMPLLEMAFAGNCGVVDDLPLPPNDSSKLAPFAALFAEELGLLSACHGILSKLEAAGVSCSVIGNVTSEPTVKVSEGGEIQIGSEPWDTAMSDLLRAKASLKEFKGLVFVGGFSYADVLDSAKGWAGTIRVNELLVQQFQEFYNRPDTFSLGVCNNCQVMALLGWVPGAAIGGTLGVGRDENQPRFVHNESGRFECRFSSVGIEESPAFMLRGMAGTKVGIWVTHGEGRALFPDQSILDQVKELSLAPIRYCNDSGEAAEVYPFNPNGSPKGIAALCSPDGAPFGDHATP